MCIRDRWLAGGNIAATNAEERSFSMFVFSGTENDRAACTVPPVPGQMLVRCYTEAMGVYGVPIDPGKHTLTIDLRLNADGAYLSLIHISARYFLFSNFKSNTNVCQASPLIGVNSEKKGLA